MEIHLYTMGQGTSVFERFGHAAVCLHHPERPQRDRCFNYGTARFDDPAGLGWNFLRGRARFWVGMQAPSVMMKLYTQLDRDVYRQVLPLPQEQAQAIADKLDFDSQEANRYYSYHHYHDNCTTRIRDILDEHTGGRLREGSDQQEGHSFRDLTREGVADSIGLLQLSDVILGRVGDEKPSLWQAMFLPRIFRAEVEKRYGAVPEKLYSRRGPAFSTEPRSQRLVWFVVSVLLAAPMLWCLVRRARIRIWHRAPALVVSGGIALVLWGLMAVSLLPMIRWNENLLLFFPLDLLLLAPRRPWKERYAQFRVALIVLAVLAALVGLLSQPLWATASLPLLGLLPLAWTEARADSDSPNTSHGQSDVGTLLDPERR